MTRLTDDDAIRQGVLSGRSTATSPRCCSSPREPDVSPLFRDDPKIFHAVNTALRYGPSVRERLLPLLMRGVRKFPAWAVTPIPAWTS